MARKPTRKQKAFAVVAFVAIGSVLGFVIYLARAHHGAQGGKFAEATISFLYGLLSAFVIALLAFAIGPVKNWFEDYLASPEGEEIRILLFGQTGTGKTSFASFVMMTKPLQLSQSTEAFTATPGVVRLAQGRDIPVVLGDYRGQEPSQATVYIPDSFAGIVGHRVVNAVIFFTDLVGREFDHDQPGQILDDNRLLAWLLENADERVQARIDQHHSYLSSAVLEILFSAVWGDQLKRIFFLITKSDLLVKAAQTGRVQALRNGDLADAAKDCFADVVARINAACAKNNIPSCHVEVISLRDESARNFVYHLVNDLAN
jgi:hypothetical protein